MTPLKRIRKGTKLYEQLLSFDKATFIVEENRDGWTWWAGVKDGEIVFYCACKIAAGICILTRAWVAPDWRGKGKQRRMIRERVRYAKCKGCTSVITYTVPTNHASSNNLIYCVFTLFSPQYPWVGDGVLYWRLKLWQ
jgi:GNAT superfamily N-acetyltransferase